jgi:hypothetical protein
MRYRLRTLLILLAVLPPLLALGWWYWPATQAALFPPQQPMLIQPQEFGELPDAATAPGPREQRGVVTDNSPRAQTALFGVF